MVQITLGTSINCPEESLGFFVQTADIEPNGVLSYNIRSDPVVFDLLLSLLEGGESMRRWSRALRDAN